MKVYRALWYGVCGLLVMVGAGVAGAVWSVPALAVIAISGAAVGGILSASHHHSGGRQVPSWPAVWRRVRTVSPAAAVAAVAVGGLGHVLGLLVPLVLLVLAGSSPYAVRTCIRYWPSSASRARGPLTVPAPREPPSSPPSVGFSSARPPGTLSNAELCRAWRRSFLLLQGSPSASSRVRIVQARQGYLDEFERRNPQGLSAWLESGARAAGDPSRFLA